MIPTQRDKIQREFQSANNPHQNRKSIHQFQYSEFELVGNFALTVKTEYHSILD